MSKFKNYLENHPYVIHLVAYILILASLLMITYQLHSINKKTDDVIFRKVENIQEYLNSQKICSDSNPEYCQSLYNRLSKNISDNQRFRLTCSVIENLDPETVSIKSSIECDKYD